MAIVQDLQAKPPAKYMLFLPPEHRVSACVITCITHFHLPVTFCKFVILIKMDNCIFQTISIFKVDLHTPYIGAPIIQAPEVDHHEE